MVQTWKAVCPRVKIRSLNNNDKKQMEKRPSSDMCNGGHLALNASLLQNTGKYNDYAGKWNLNPNKIKYVIVR